MLDNILRQQTLTNIANRVSIQHMLAPDDGSEMTNHVVGSNKDIFGQDKQKLKMTEASRYFMCENCGRKVAGGRFALHVNKCLERKRK